MNASPPVASLQGLGDLLKSARQRRGLTLRELSEDPDVGVTATFLSRVERNDSLPSDELVLKLSRKLGIDASVALLHLFRDRASPEVREHVPNPSLLKLQEGTAGREEYPGLEVIAEPLSQMLDIHRNVLGENARLRQQISRLTDDVHQLSAEVSESKRGYLPHVNRFLLSLFNCESEVVRRDVVVSRSGDASISVTVEGVAPKKGMKPLRSLVHSVVLPQAVDGSLNIAGQPALFEILEKPDDLEVEWSFKRESSERGNFLVTFPQGFDWKPGRGTLSYRFSYRLEKTFVMTFEEAKVRHPEIWARMLARDRAPAHDEAGFAIATDDVRQLE